MHIGFALLAIVAAFILGSLEGGRVWTWVKSWFHKKAAAPAPTTVTGPSGKTGA